MPYKFVNNDKWQIDLHGTYIGPIKLFQGFVQKDMIEAYEKGKPKSLPFVFDYHPTNYGLIVARKKV
jgi:hypothetical protein